MDHYSYKISWHNQQYRYVLSYSRAQLESRVGLHDLRNGTCTCQNELAPMVYLYPSLLKALAYYLDMIKNLHQIWC